MGSKSILRFGPYEDPRDYSGWPRGVLQLRSAWEKEAEIAESGEDRGSHCVGSDRRALLELRARTIGHGLAVSEPILPGGQLAMKTGEETSRPPKGWDTNRDAHC